MGWLKDLAKLIVIGLIVNMLLKYAIDPAISFLTYAPFVLFNVIATAITFLFLALILYGVWWLFRGCWKFLTKQETRSALWVKVRDWQPTRSDLALAVILTYPLAQGVFIVGLTSTIPRDQLQGIASPDQLTSLVLVMIVPMMASMCIMLVWYGYRQYQDLHKQWQSNDRRHRTYIFIRVFLFAAVVTIFVTGNLLGWNERLWFTSN